MTRFLNISTDNTLGGSSPSDEFVASQKAIKEYVDNNSSNVQVDNLTITTNASDEIQTIAAINQNSGILKFWKGSKLEYDNLPSHDPDTQYTVTGDNTAGMMPTGSIIPFAGTNIPDGYLLCDGSAISRTTYADLFAVIGTVYGTGDGSTTFNLPNMNLRTIIYSTYDSIGHYDAGSLPNIKGSVGHNSGIGHVSGISFGVSVHDSSMSGAFFGGASCNYTATERTQRTNGKALGFNASRSSGVYRDDNTGYVIPAHVNMYYVVKY